MHKTRIAQLADDMNELLKENEELRNKLKLTDEWLKLAICDATDHKLSFRSTANANKHDMDAFLMQTTIAICGDGITIYDASELGPLDELRPKKIDQKDIDALFNDAPIENA